MLLQIKNKEIKEPQFSENAFVLMVDKEKSRLYPAIFLVCFHIVERADRALFPEGTNTIHEGSTFMS
jgi:hypothetical protein